MPSSIKSTEKLPWKYYRYIAGFFVLGFSYWSAGVSSFYTPYIFKPISNFLRFLFGKIYFPIGELVYLALVITLIFSCLNWIWINRRDFIYLSFWKYQLVKWLNGLFAIFIVFELIWGLNYQKLDPSKDFKLKVPLAYTERQMDSLSLKLINDLNFTRSKMGDFDPKMMNFDTVLGQNRVEFAKNAQNGLF